MTNIIEEMKEIQEKNEEKRPNLFYMHTDGEDPEDEIELLLRKEEIDFTNIRKLIEKNNKHLFLFDELKKELSYQGKNTKILTRHLWYRFNSLMQPSKRVVINSQVATDNHIHDLIIAGAGNGKGLKKNCEKRLCRINEISPYYEISSLSHKEQLIGKNVVKNKEKVTVKGYLWGKSLQHDEAQNVINETDGINSESMRIIRQAMDVYGDNEISKKLIEDTYEQTLKYFSQSRVTQLIHPTKLENNFFQTGTYRRYNAVIDLGTDKDIDIEKITSLELTNPNSLNPFTNVIQTFYERPIVDLNYDSLCLGILSDFNAMMLEFCLKHGNPNLERYGLMTKYTLRLLLLRYVNVLHFAYKKSVSDPLLTLCGCLDFFYVWTATIESFIKYGRLDIQEDVWFGLDEESVLALQYLNRKNCVSESSSNVSIKRFQTVLAELFGVKITQSRAKMRDLEKRGFICSRQVGQHQTKVWLLKVPEKLNVLNDWYYPGFIVDFFEGDSRFSGVSAPSFGCFIDEKSFKKSQGDEGVGVSGSLNNIYTHKITQLINLIIIYIQIDPNTLSPLSPCVSEETLSTEEEEFEGNKTQDNRPLPSTINEEISIPVHDSGLIITQEDLIIQIKNKTKNFEKGVPSNELSPFCENEKWFDKNIKHLIQNGEVFETKPGFYKLV